MGYILKQMNKEHARDISKWIYEKPYNIYSGDESDEFIEELLDGSYFVALDERDKLVGFYCFGSSAQVPAGNVYKVYEDLSFLDIGLGMRPDLCGGGKGYEFFIEGLELARKVFPSKKMRLTVAAFNNRAINLYKKIGFREVDSFDRKGADGDMTFIVMEMKTKGK